MEPCGHSGRRAGRRGGPAAWPSNADVARCTMSERNGAVAGPSIDPGSGPPEERRRAIRQAPEEEQGTLSWQEDADRITCVATVLSLSGQGAAVLAEQSP